MATIVTVAGSVKGKSKTPKKVKEPTKAEQSKAAKKAAETNKEGQE